MGLIRSIRRLFRRPAYRTPAETPQQPQTATTPSAPTTPAGRAHHGESGFDGPIAVNVSGARGYSPAEAEKLRQATELLSKVLGSEAFRQRILEHQYRGGAGFADSDGLSNAQVYEKLMAARETYTDADDHEVDLDLEIKNLGWRGRNVVGYTYPDVATVTQNRKFFALKSPADIAANLAHEWVHKLGFGHDFRQTAPRPYSVPYAVGDIVGELAKALEG